MRWRPRTSLTSTSLEKTSTSSATSAGTWMSNSVSTTLLLRSRQSSSFLLASMVTPEPVSMIVELDVIEPIARRPPHGVDRPCRRGWCR